MPTPDLGPPPPHACPLPPLTAPAPQRAPSFALAADGTVHLLVRDASKVCWWAITEDGDATVRAAWSLPGPHPVALLADEAGAVVLLGVTTDGWCLSVVAPGGVARDIPLGGTPRPVPERLLRGEPQVLGNLDTFELDGAEARVAWRRTDGRAVFARVDLARGGVDLTSKLVTGGADAPQAHR